MADERDAVSRCRMYEYTLLGPPVAALPSTGPAARREHDRDY